MFYTGLHMHLVMKNIHHTGKKARKGSFKKVSKQVAGAGERAAVSGMTYSRAYMNGKNLMSKT